MLFLQNNLYFNASVQLGGNYKTFALRLNSCETWAMTPVRHKLLEEILVSLNLLSSIDRY